MKLLQHSGSKIRWTIGIETCRGSNHLALVDEGVGSMLSRCAKRRVKPDSSTIIVADHKYVLLQLSLGPIYR